MARVHPKRILEAAPLPRTLLADAIIARDDAPSHLEQKKASIKRASDMVFAAKQSWRLHKTNSGMIPPTTPSISPGSPRAKRSRPVRDCGKRGLPCRSPTIA